MKHDSPESLPIHWRVAQERLSPTCPPLRSETPDLSRRPAEPPRAASSRPTASRETLHQLGAPAAYMLSGCASHSLSVATSRIALIAPWSRMTERRQLFAASNSARQPGAKPGAADARAPDMLRHRGANRHARSTRACLTSNGRGTSRPWWSAAHRVPIGSGARSLSVAQRKSSAGTASRTQAAEGYAETDRTRESSPGLRSTGAPHHAPRRRPPSSPDGRAPAYDRCPRPAPTRACFT